MEEYDDSYETKFAEKTEKQKIDAAIELGYWSDSDDRSLGSITDKEHNTEYTGVLFCEIEELQRNQASGCGKSSGCSQFQYGMEWKT